MTIKINNNHPFVPLYQVHARMRKIFLARFVILPEFKDWCYIILSFFSVRVFRHYRTPSNILQAQRSCAISSFIPIAFNSFPRSTLSTTPITFILVQFLHNYSNMPILTLPLVLNTFNAQTVLESHRCAFSSFTRHLFAPILSALLNLARSSAFIAQVSLPYTNTLWTGINIVSKRHPWHWR